MKRICITLNEKTEAQLLEMQEDLNMSRAQTIRFVVNEYCVKKNVKVNFETKPRKEQMDPRAAKEIAQLKDGTYKGSCPSCGIIYPKCGCTFEEVSKKIINFYKYS